MDQQVFLAYTIFLLTEYTILMQRWDKSIGRVNTCIANQINFYISNVQNELIKTKECSIHRLSVTFRLYSPNTRIMYQFSSHTSESDTLWHISFNYNTVIDSDIKYHPSYTCSIVCSHCTESLSKLNSVCRHRLGYAPVTIFSRLIVYGTLITHVHIHTL